MGAAKIGRKTDNTVADTMAPVAAKKTQMVFSEAVSISERHFSQSIFLICIMLNFNLNVK